jgi:hypothetical protein
MANRDTPSGARPVGHLTGGLVRPAMEPFAFADDYATATYSGDFVKLLDTGVIARAAAGDELLGVFYGVQYKTDNGEYVFSKHWPAAQSASEIKAFVYSDPNIIYEIQHDSDSATPAAADVGLCYDIVATAGSTVFQVSREEIDTSTGLTASGQLRQIGFVERADNEIGEFAKALVVINEHIYRGTDGI